MYLPKRTFINLGIGALILITAFITIIAVRNYLPWTVSRVGSPYYQGCSDQKIIAFTFNVDWGEEYLPKVLEILKDENIKATFFITGRWAEKHPDLVKSIAQNGNEIGNHGLKHQHLKDLSQEQLVNEIKGGEQVLQGITGKRPRLFAPAFGEYNSVIGEVAASADCDIIMWSLDTIDWQNPDVNTIISRVVPRIHNDAIILMHPTDPTVKALPEMIKQLKSEGYKFSTVSKIIKPSPINKKTAR
ncbi:MAG: polysaccharide deacetylase family protein [Chitinophagales bacterium]